MTSHDATPRRGSTQHLNSRGKWWNGI